MLEKWFDETLPLIQFQCSSYQAKAMLVKSCDKCPEVWPSKARNWDWLEEYFQKRLQVEASTRDARSKGKSEPGAQTVGGKAKKELPRLKVELEARLSSGGVTVRLTLP